MPAESAAIVFLGHTKEWWDLVNGLANWLAALGTIGAVIVALYLARAQSRIRLKVEASSVLVLNPGQTGTPPGYCQVSVTNKSQRVARVTQIGWRVGFFRKQYMVQLFDGSMSSKLPIDLTDGQEARWLIPYADKQSWLEKFSEDFLLPHWRIKLPTVRVLVFTSLGGNFDAKLNHSLTKRLAETCKQLSKRPSANA